MLVLDIINYLSNILHHQYLILLRDDIYHFAGISIGYREVNIIDIHGHLSGWMAILDIKYR